MEASSSAGATRAPAQVTRPATMYGTLAPAEATQRAPETRESHRQIAFLLLGGILLLYGAAGFGLYEFFTFVF
jgi:hypothetical protein